ncbi:hypothetical protein JR316_0000962 [Psilocybe cubensis]|uniref:Uncharacterized protein n=1 Tax=Psilocybe cubensis TaxID=181762 RepID=A0ACB8HGV2_PSICU|nr:hypothetical protein JR316_0000962 [Psilocybe cubensis]KAH9486897.1 hypothetical protein JR316_0000962 [Psilocybe cubensis]
MDVCYLGRSVNRGGTGVLLGLLACTLPRFRCLEQLFLFFTTSMDSLIPFTTSGSLVDCVDSTSAQSHRDSPVPS